MRSLRSICAPRTSAAGAGRSRAVSATSVRRSRRCCRCSKNKTDRSHLEQARSHYQKARAGARRTCRRPPGHKPIHPQQMAKTISDCGSAGRGLHLRRGPADGMGGALSRHERQTAADRFVLARLDGERACRRRSVRRRRSPAGRCLALRRWRLHDAAWATSSRWFSRSCR